MHQQAISEDHFSTIKNSTESLFKDKGSRFYGFCFPVKDLTEVNTRLDELKSNYYDARHHCYAYRINPKKPEVRINDDGEPSNSAGAPIFNQILSHEVWNVLVVVVRYFGGTKLGISGMINAYKTAAEKALSQCEKLEAFYHKQYELRFPYEDMGLVSGAIKESSAQIVNECMEMDAGYIVECRESEVEKVLRKFESINSLIVKEVL